MLELIVDPCPEALASLVDGAVLVPVAVVLCSEPPNTPDEEVVLVSLAVELTEEVELGLEYDQ